MTHVLLTGRPGVGKTTIIKRVITESCIQCSGFFTGDVRDTSGNRVGFEVQRVGEASGHMFASSNFTGKSRVGKYIVNIPVFERVALPALDIRGTEVTIIDEIGKMEMLSTRFMASVIACFNRGHVLATIPLIGGGSFVEMLKTRPDVVVIEATRENRDTIVSKIITLLRLDP